ncbi:hypothetical protein D3C80_1507570 [compost metagenome]
MNYSADLLTLFNLNQVDDRRSTRCAPKLWDFIGFDPVYLTLIGKEHQIVMGVAHEEMLHKILILGIHSDYTASAPLLAAVRADRQTFNVAGVCNRNNDLFTRNQILIQNTFFTHRNFSPAFVGIFIADFLQLVADNLQDKMLVSQNFLVLGNFGYQLVIFVLDLLPFQSGQALHPHIEDSLCLLDAETKSLH